jgi:hypothetical protein
MEERTKKGILALTRVFSIAYIRHRSIHAGALLRKEGKTALDRTWHLTKSRG